MSLYRDQGVVLRTIKLGEADRIVTLVTAGHGKVRAVAKGVRKTKSRFGSRLEPMSHVDLLLYAGRELDVVTQAEVLDHFRPVREDLGRLARATAMLEAVDQVAQEREPNVRLYEMLVGALRALAARDAPLLVPAFFWKLLALEGLQPMLDVCVSCGAPDDLVAFDLDSGGALCRSCRRGVALSSDALALMHPRVWEASGHVETFTDPLVDCRNCKERWREDQLEGVCPKCGSSDFTPARAFNLMFKTNVGPVEHEGSIAYLRPETAQGIFVNFLNVVQASRKKPPFGIAQMGKSFRNEITPGNFIFRTREFEQMEMEYFVPPSESSKWFEYWCAERLRWYTDLGIPADKLRLRDHDADELSHYSVGTADVEFEYPWGWGELEGIAQRTDYDLTRHAES